jgi:hypothetical protein
MGGGGGGGGPMGMLNSQSKIQMEPQTGVTFADVSRPLPPMSADGAFRKGAFLPKYTFLGKRAC